MRTWTLGGDIPTWSLDGDGLALVVNETAFTEAELITLAESAVIPR